MSWKFAGVLFEQEFGNQFPVLLERLGVERHYSSRRCSFFDAIRADNEATALAIVNGRTVLVDKFLSYDCSYEPGQSSGLDRLLGSLSGDRNILNFIVDGVSGTYCFTLFSRGRRIRRWATEPGNIWCDEGQPLLAESQQQSEVSANNEELPFSTMNDDEAHLLAVWEDFLGLSFQDLLRDDKLSFQLFE